jgi:hypothetical protein
MTKGAYAIHKHLNKPDSEFFGKTQALTAAFNGRALQIFAHYAIQDSGPSKKGKAAIKYYQWRLFTDNPKDELEELRRARKHLRKA